MAFISNWLPSQAAFLIARFALAQADTPRAK
jgi:hypothetical protein